MPNVNELHEAAQSGDIGLLTELLNSGADVNAQDSPLHMTPLHWAASHGHVAACKLLVERGAYVESRDYFDTTPLHRAAKGGHVKVADLLIALGADVNSKAEVGNTPLHVAAGEGQTYAADLLLHRGANINAKDLNGNEPLYWAAVKGHLDACEVLLRLGADVNAKNLFGRTALDGAQEQGHSEICRLLLERGADLTYRQMPFTMSETGDAFVDSCFQIPFQEFKDDRDWRKVPGAQDIANASNQGRNEEALHLLNEFERQYADFWFTHYWYAIISRRQGRLNDARAFCLNGLRVSKSKIDLCAMMGTIEYESGNLGEAIKWWIRSSVLQLHANQLSNHDPFLQLSYLAEAFGLFQTASALRRIVDEVSPSIRPRLNDDAVRRLLNRASQCLGKESMKHAIAVLDKNFFSC